MRIIILGLLLAAAPAFAQPEAQRALLREKVRNAAVQRLSQRLKLDAATTARMAAVAKNIDDQVAAVQADSGKSHRELKQLIESGHADDASILKLTDHILANRARMHQLEDMRTTEVRKLLKPIDYGRLVLAWPKINREIRAEIYKAMAPDGAGPPDEQ